MKKLVLSVATLAMVFIIGCNGGGGDPKAVAQNFFEALGKKDFEGAKKYATSDTKATLDMLKSFAAMAPKDDKKDEKFNKDDIVWGILI